MTDDRKLLCARFDDKLQQSARGGIECGCFYSPADAVFLSSLSKAKGADDRFFLFGGYDGAERKMAFFLPDFLSEFDGSPKEKAVNFFPDEFSCAIRAVKVVGSGYRSLSHRDHLGSLLSLGIERESLGDIVILSDFEAVIFCTNAIFGFLLESIDRIASDKVSASEFIPDSTFSAKKELLPINDTVASPRFDCVVAALTNFSREKAQTAIKSGLCSLDYFEELRPDREIIPPCTISVRGCGKFNVLSIGGETKRGRLRMYAEKYI